MKILRMGYVFNALWSIKIWLPPRAPLSPLSVGPVPKNRPSPRTSGWELESQIRGPSRLRARDPGCQKLNIPPAASVATEPPSCARYARIALTKPLRRPRPQGQPPCFAHMTTVSARAQSTCSVMAAFAEPGASRRRSASRGPFRVPETATRRRRPAGCAG